ncbi:myopalladin isoform X2 [Periophthalmus magnuspinnatus]|uniref:myopalladin isoform X2 n=1 Tax=Periophthalmus magnuspinnatus TaxID=409849 RepID=UPI0024364AE4|nr:myopalladin isoform X2 [Periophthalmus magnuspinnatus]
MQDNTEQQPSLSQMLRESYLAEARAQQRHSEMSRSDASSSRLQIYSSLKGKAEDSMGHTDQHFPDLSAFLSQEELDKSVNLARQAIGHEPRDERAEVKGHSEICSAPVTYPPTSSDSFTNSPSINVPFNPTQTNAITQPASEFRETPHTTYAPDRKTHKPSSRQDNVRNSRDSGDAYNDFNRSSRSVPYGLETQSKKEFLNKAADFIEELSSLFKANSSKRVRPRSCKTHRGRSQNKSQADGMVLPIACDNRERSVLAPDIDKDRPGPVDDQEPEVQADSRTEEFQEGVSEEQQFATVTSEGTEAESTALTESSFPVDTVCEPPKFIQKLKSREVSEGSKVQLDCIVQGQPVPEVRWFCEGKELENCPDIQIITNGEHHSLIIAEAFEEDTGRYSCFASNFYGTDSTSAEIYVEGASSSDSEDQRLERAAQQQWKQKSPSTQSDQSLSAKHEPVEPNADSPEEVQLTEELTLAPSNPLTTDPSVSAPEPLSSAPEPLSSAPEPLSSAPEPLSSAPVPLSSAPVLLSSAPVPLSSPPEEINVSPITLPTIAPVQQLFKPVEAERQEVLAPVQLHLTPTSQVQPSNSVVSSVLTVPAPPPTQATQAEIQIFNHSVKQDLNGQQIMAAPVFTKRLQDLDASEGQLVVLECRVKGTPSPRVEWYQDSKLIQDSPEFRILQKKPRSPTESEDICTLVIAEVFPEDSGTFKCTASNNYGSVSSTAELKIKGNANHTNHMRSSSILSVEPSQTQPAPVDLTLSKPQSELTVTGSIKAHSSTIRLDPLISTSVRLDPLNTSTLRLDPQTSSMLRPDPLRNSLPTLEPSNVNNSNYFNSKSSSTPNLDPLNVNRNVPVSSIPQSETHNISQGLFLKPILSQPIVKEKENLPTYLDLTTATNNKVSSNHQNETPVIVSLPDPPPNSCLKTGTLKKSRHQRSRSRRVHFKLPEDEEHSEPASQSESEDNAHLNKEPPPVLAKPKLDPAQLQLLHNQVLLEQQQDSDPPAQTETSAQPHQPVQVQIQSDVQAQENPIWSPRLQREPHPPPFHPYVSTVIPPPQTQPPAPPFITTTITSTAYVNTAPAPRQPPVSAPLLTSTMTAPTVNTTFSAPVITSPLLPSFSSAPPIPQFKSPAQVMTSPPPAPQLSTLPPSLSAAPVTQMNTIHASHLNLSPAALGRTAPVPQFFTPPAPKLSTVQTDSTISLQQVTSPATFLRSTHASLMNLSATSQTFNYARPKEFITAQSFSPVRSPSPTESPVPLLQELAAEFSSSATSSPTIPPFSPPPRIFPTRVLQSPTSPPSLVSSPTLGSMLLNTVFGLRAQSPPQAASPTSSSSTPSPIQNPVAFLSSVLPSLSPLKATNEMGLPKRAPIGPIKKTAKARVPSLEEIRESKECLLMDIEKKLRLKDDTPQYQHQQEYKISNFEQRLMSEIEFRLERTPVEESDDEVQHEDVPTGKCIAPIFDKKLKNFRAMEGVPVTFSCKLVGVPVPKVYWFKDGKQILRKNTHYRKIREGDGTCALHIESVTSDDDGNYTVMAANPQGRISCSGHLIVQTGSARNRQTPISAQRVRSRIQEVETEQTQERFFRPHFLQAPGDMMAHEGKLCRLDCKVSGLPNPELMWLVNGRPIYPDLYHKMLVRENGVHSLVIDPLTQKDAGTYTCIASNKAGQSSFNLELSVVEKEMKHPPQFVEKLQNMGIPEGTPVRLECRVVGMPSPVIFWKKDNETIPRTRDRISMHQDVTGYVCLLIQPTTKEDAGWYTVSAKNEAGIVSCTCRLDIYAQWHQSVPAPMKKTQRTGSRYAALTGQGLDIKSAFCAPDTSPYLFASSPPEATLESDEL